MKNVLKTAKIPNLGPVFFKVYYQAISIVVYPFDIEWLYVI